MRVELLHGGLSLLTDGGRRLDITDETDRWLLITFLWASRLAPTPVPHAEFRSATGIGLSDAGLRKRVERLRQRYDLAISSVYKVGYRLELTGTTVDAFEFLERMSEANNAPADAPGRGVLYRAARRLWMGGLPVFTEYPFPAPELYAECARFGHILRTHGRRILVVDDQIADALADRLRSFNECSVARSWDEYTQTSSELDTYDLVVVDLHLTSDYSDRRGEDVVNDISRRAPGVPVFMMTMRPPRSVDLGSWGSSLGVAKVAFKGGDGAQADIPGIAGQIVALLEDDPREQACRQIERGIVDLRRRALNLIIQRAGDSRTAQGTMTRMETFR